MSTRSTKVRTYILELVPRRKERIPKWILKRKLLKKSIRRSQSKLFYLADNRKIVFFYLFQFSQNETIEHGKLTNFRFGIETREVS